MNTIKHLILVCTALVATGCASRPQGPVRPTGRLKTGPAWHVRFDENGQPIATPLNSEATSGRISAPVARP